MKNIFPLFADLLQAATLSPDPMKALSVAHRDTQDELRQQFPDQLRGFAMPFFAGEQRSIQATSAAGGGYAVGVSVGEIGPSLRSSLVLDRLGASVLIGLKSDLSLPYGLAELTGSWASETAAAPVRSESFNRLFLSPKRLTATLRVTKQLVAQGAAAEPVLRREILDALAAEIERVAIAGRTGGTMSEPVGILSVSGVHVVAGGANGAAPTWDHVTQLEYLVGNSNGREGSTGWICSPLVRRRLRRTFINGAGSGPVWGESRDELLGHPAGVTTSSPDNLSKGSSSGTCSAIIHGDFSELVVGLWGPGIDIVADPYSEAAKGLLLVHVSAFVDCGVRNPKAFAVMKDALAA